MKTANKSFLAKAETVERKWYVVDASEKSLGRLAARIATVLMGKHKPSYTPHVDTGDYVVVTNAERVRLTGRKRETKIYQSYSRYPGGRKVVPVERVLQRRPERVLQDAVRRMLPKNTLARQMITKLKLYKGAQHPHQAQQPEPLPL